MSHKDYKEGFLHAIVQTKTNSMTELDPILREVLSEEGFDHFPETLPYIKYWTQEQGDVLRSILGD